MKLVSHLVHYLRDKATAVLLVAVHANIHECMLEINTCIHNGNVQTYANTVIHSYLPPTYQSYTTHTHTNKGDKRSFINVKNLSYSFISTLRTVLSVHTEACVFSVKYIVSHMKFYTFCTYTDGVLYIHILYYILVRFQTCTSNTHTHMKIRTRV